VTGVVMGKPPAIKHGGKSTRNGGVFNGKASKNGLKEKHGLDTR